MSRATQIGIILVIFLAIVVSIGGGALAGGAAGFYLARQEIARFEQHNEQVVSQTVSAATEESEAASDLPRALPQTQELPERPDMGNLSDTMVDAVEQVAPAVVMVINRNGGELGSGSGVVVSEDGYIITNHHVVNGATDLDVIFSDSSIQEAELIGSDELSDIAVIQVSDDVPAIAPIGDAEALRPGEPVMAIGSPLGSRFRNTVTSGVVSAMNRSVAQLEGLIQTDASINRGNSGGPLINLRGEVIGINTLVVRGESVFGGDQAEGLGFAVPSTIFRIVSEQIIQNGEMTYPYLGVRYSMIDAIIAAEEDLPVTEGAYIATVEADTPADDAGLQEDDIVIAIDGVSLAQGNSLRYVLTQYQPGQEVELTVQRGDEIVTLTLTLGTRPADLDVIPAPGTP